MKVTESRNKREGRFLKGRRDMRTYHAKYSRRARTGHYYKVNKDYPSVCNCSEC